MLAPDLSALPGGELVMAGLRDLAAGQVDTVPALLVEIGRPRLVGAGIDVPGMPPAVTDAELRLYARLIRDGDPDAYGTYNSLLRRLVSCEAALERGNGFATQA